MKKTILTCVLISAGLLTSTVQAEDYNPEKDAVGAYIGANYGYLLVIRLTNISPLKVVT